MKKLVIGLVLISIFTLTSVVSAQTTLEFDVVQIQFWPEYDRPDTGAHYVEIGRQSLA